MANPPFPPRFRLLAATSDGPVDKDLLPQGVAAQAPDPGSLLAVVAVAGDGGTASNQTGGAAIAGNGGTATNLRYGVAYVGIGGQATGGADTISIVQSGGKASSADGGIAVAKRDGQASVNNWGIAIAYEGGTASAGVDGVIIIGYRNAIGEIRLKVGHIGYDGLTPGTHYKLGRDHQFIAA